MMSPRALVETLRLGITVVSLDKRGNIAEPRIYAHPATNVLRYY